MTLDPTESVKAISRSIDDLLGRLRAPVSFRETIVWCLTATVLLLVHLLVVNDGPHLSNDSYQYLSVAENFGSGRLGETSIVHFDTEHSHERVPAPMTTFPPGYSVAIAALHQFGLPRAPAGVAISMAAVVLLPLAFYWSGAVFGIGGLGTRFLNIWVLGNSAVANFANSVLTEALFTFLTFVAVLLFVAALNQPDDPRKQTALFLGANALIGASVLVRYSGLFLFAATALYVAFLVVRRRDRTSARAAASLTVSASLIGFVMVRNHVLVGTWKGGNDVEASRSIAEVVHDFAASAYFLFVGELGPTHSVALQLSFLLIVGAGLVFAAVGLKRSPTVDSWPRGHAEWFPAVYVITYCALLTFTGLTTVISISARMLVPIFPIVLLMVAMALQRIERVPRTRILVSSVIVLSGIYLAINLLSYVKPLPMTPDEKVTQLLTERAPSNETVATWIDANIDRAETVVASQGQAIGHVLQRKTVSLVSDAFSATTWDEQRVRSTMRTYRARHLIVFDDVDAPEIRESPFLSGLLRRPPPRWLQLRIRSPHVAIFEASA